MKAVVLIILGLIVVSIGIKEFIKKPKVIKRESTHYFVSKDGREKIVFSSEDKQLNIKPYKCVEIRCYQTGSAYRYCAE